MKKRIVCTCLSMAMALLLAFPLAGCGSSESNESSESSESNEKSTIYYVFDPEGYYDFDGEIEPVIVCFDNGIDCTYDPESRDLIRLEEEGILHTAEIEGKTDIIIPDTIEGHPVVLIDAATFRDCSSLKSIRLPDEVMIESGAFRGCSKDLILYGKKGSVAEEYAKEYNITFKEKGK